MKNIFFALYTAVSVSIALSGAANAQTPNNTAMLSYSYEKRIPLQGELNKSEDSGFHYFNEIHSRAIRGFMQVYNDVYNVKWAKYYGGYVASFERDSINTRLYYNRRGDFEVQLRYYFENRLSPEIRKMVRSKYFDYRIFQISESSGIGTTFYQIKIRDKADCKIIGIVNGEMELILEYSDADPY